MFLGEFDRSLDPKGRLVLPAEHREVLGETGYLSKALGNILAIRQPEKFKEMLTEMELYARKGPQQRRLATEFSSGAHLVVPDKQGRIAIPAKLRDYAGLTGDVMVVGGNARIEIWDRRRWYDSRPSDDVGFDPSNLELASFGV